MIYTDPTAAAPAVRAALNAAERVLILSHINPDGDAIGSLLAVDHALRGLGKRTIPLASSALPGYALWLPGVAEVAVYRPGTALPKSDLIFLVDTAALSRVGQIFTDHAAELAERPLVIVDHHVTNDGVNGVNLIDSRSASTCELLYRLFVAMDLPITPAMASCLLLGATTDTQSYQTPSTTATALRVAADLIAAGADHERVVQEVYYALPASTLELIGQALAGLQVAGPIAWATVTQEMMRRTGAEDEAADEVLRLMKRIGGLRALALFKERRDGTTKLSLRSVPPYNVAALAQTWGGGGHAQASGATLLLPPNQAAETVLPLLRDLVSA